MASRSDQTGVIDVMVVFGRDPATSDVQEPVATKDPEPWAGKFGADPSAVPSTLPSGAVTVTLKATE